MPTAFVVNGRVPASFRKELLGQQVPVARQHAEQ
jgi:hypothetical protein